MKKLSFIWPLLLVFVSCHKPQNGAVKDHWKYYAKAYGFLSTHKDSAFYYFNRAALDTADKLQVALAYYNMALIQSDEGDNYGAQESLTLSLKSLDERNPEDRQYVATDYNQLGMTFSNLNDHKQALNCYRQALQYTDSAALKAYILNNQGNAYKDIKAYTAALSSFNEVIKIVGTKGSDYARTLTNIAVTKWQKDPKYNAGPELRRSLAIRTQSKDLWGENSSYGHLADFYTVTKPDTALAYAGKMLKVAENLNSPDDRQFALKKLVGLAPANQTKIYFQQFQQLSDSIQSARNIAKNQFAVIRYNVEKAREDNLDLQRKNTERRYELIGVVVFSLFSAVWGIWLYGRRRQRIRLEAERDIRESKYRLSQKVHDRVANGIYRMMSEVEHQPDLNRERLLDQLENMYDVSRNIAHEEPDLALDYTERIHTMFYAFKRSSIRLGISGNEPDLWVKVSAEAKEQLMFVLQELMVNMSKHSQATQAHIGFSINEGSLYIEYRDDGVGLKDKRRAGKGIRHTVSRIEALNGSIRFDGGEANGLHVFIQLPIVY